MICLTHTAHLNLAKKCHSIFLRKMQSLGFIILLLFCLHRGFIFDNRLTGEAKRSLLDILNSVAMCLEEFI